jgi:TrkA domain protein
MSSMRTPEPRPQLTGADVTQQILPGIGQRFDMDLGEEGEVAVVIHHGGRRDVYLLDRGADEPWAGLSLSDGQARTLGAILGGAYFKPAVVEEIEAVLGRVVIDWVTLHARSPAAGRTIAELDIRRETGMTIAAIMREHVPLVAPGPHETLVAGDRLVIVGRREDLGRFRRHVVG